MTTITAGVLLVIQMALAFAVSGARGQRNVWVGDGGQDALLRAIRRHGNLAENAGIFVIGFMLLELSKFSPTLLMCLCAAFVLVRLAHVVGLSQPDTGNVFRIAGGVGTYLLGFALGGALIWVGVLAAGAAHAG
jgi:uncharacterized membrane protein YecN with MAPEG domain